VEAVQAAYGAPVLAALEAEEAKASSIGSTRRYRAAGLRGDARALPPPPLT
jgi:hypothetical protein